MREAAKSAWICVGLLVLLAGCGGGGEEAAQSEGPAAEPLATGTPDPPPQEDIDIDSDGIDVGGNDLSTSTTVGEWALPPTMFGAIADWQLEVNGNVIPLTNLLIRAGEGEASNWVFSVTNLNGNVNYTVEYLGDDPGNPLAVNPTAYTPTDGDCSLMGAGMERFFSPEAQYAFNVFTSTVGHEYQDFTSGVSISYKITPAAETGCN